MMAELNNIDNIPGIALSWLNAGRKIAMATVIETWGSAPRRTGAQLVIDEAGQMMGSVSGGCVEGAVIFSAMDAISSGKSEILEFGVADEDAFAVGLACGGTIRILVQPVGDGQSFSRTDLEEIVAAYEARESIISLTNLESFEHEVRPAKSALERDAVRLDRSQISEEGFVRVYNPPLRMVVIGAVHIAQALTPMARLNNFSVAVLDPRGSFATQERFPETELYEGYAGEYLEANPLDARTAVCALTHDPKIDDPALIAALKSDAFYIGALGSRRTHAKRVDRLKAEGFDDTAIARIEAPIGLDIGAANPSEIASSIMAQIIERLRKG